MATSRKKKTFLCDAWQPVDVLGGHHINFVSKYMKHEMYRKVFLSNDALCGEATRKMNSPYIKWKVSGYFDGFVQEERY